MDDQTGKKRLYQEETAPNAPELLKELPNDVMSNILARLPVKTLLRFKCVSKNWRSIISDQSFANRVLVRSLARSDVAWLISIMGKVMPSLFCCRFFSLDPQTGFASPIHQLDQPAASTVKVSGSINGLICVDVGDLTYLCNLCTGEVVALPPTGPDFSVPLGHDVHGSSSLGFDPVTKQYKIMKTWASSFLDDSGGLITAHKVLTMGTNTWRRIPSGPIDFPSGGSICLNGAIHFLTLDFLSNNIIVALDVGSEEFRMLPFPDGVLNHIRKIKLVLYRESLAVLEYEHLHDDNKMTMHVLEDYQNQDWREQEIVLPHDWRANLPDSERLYVGSTRLGEILLAPRVTTKELYLVSYDVESRRLKKLQLCGLPESLSKSPVIMTSAPCDYIPSILSLHSLSS